MASGELEIDDVPRAASQFFTLLKGEPHAKMMFGCCAQDHDDRIHPGQETERHLEAVVDMFLRAYARH